jgi:PAS domain S-box-containing protein
MTRIRDAKRKSDESVQRILDQSPVGSVIVGLDNRFVRCNAAFCNFLGYQEDELIGKTFTEVTFHEDKGLGITEMKQIINGEIESCNLEKRYIRKDGKIVYGEIIIRLIHELNNKPSFFFAVIQDITKKKHSESLLLYKENIINCSSCAIATCDLKGKMNYGNPAFLRLWGFDNPEEFLGRPFHELWLIEDRLDEIMQVLRGSGTWSDEIQAIKKDGTYFDVCVFASTIFDSHGKPIAMTSTSTDITARKRAEKYLVSRNELLNITGTTAKVGGWELDIETLNQTWTEEVYTIHEIDFKFNPNLSSGINFYAPNSRLIVEKAVQRAIEFGEPFDLELEFFTSKGNHRWVHSIGKAYQENGKTTKLFGSFQDITQFKLTEEGIRIKNEELLKLNAEKDKFFSIIAHDLRGPFNVFLGLTRMMVDELPDLKPDQVQKFAISMKNSAGKLFNLLENLLEWSKMQRGLRSFVPRSFFLLNSLAKIIEVARDTANSKMIRISYDVPEDMMIKADIQMFESLMRNLVFNAIKFTHRGGRIKIEAMPISGNFVVISIKDTGIGMDKNQIDNLFSFEQSTNRTGTEGEPSSGLGLILCKDFVEKHHGKLWVESEAGVGSTFSFSIPADVTSEEKPFNGSVSTGKEDGRTEKLKILIAEDDEISEMLVSIAVTPFQKEVFKAKTGIEAVEICRNNPDIDLVIMDIRMPQSDGYQATRQIRNFNKEVIIIAYTAYGISSQNLIMWTY